MDRSEPSAGIPLYRFRFGTSEFDESRFELSVGGLIVEIEQKPLQLLLALLRRTGELVSREELLETVWAGRPTVEQVLNNAVAKLRKALGEADAGRIVTVPRAGYRFDGPVERIAVGARLTSRLELNAGDVVPGRENFILRTELATSVSAEVWLARHGKTGETRVYKFARGAENLSTLKREATLYRLLRQALGDREDLLRILDWNFETFPFYLECGYGGSNLFHWAQEQDQLRPLSRADRIGLFLQIADAVAAAHSVGVLHKDLKPTNVLIAERAQGGVQVLISDFGSGRLMEPGRLEELGITQLGLTVTQGISKDSGSGTPLYLAPELIAGGSPTVQSDLYALGLMLYQIVNGDLRKPMASGWEQDIGDDLLAADIAAATYGDPARRLGSVTELSQRLRSLESRRAEQTSARIARERAALAERVLERARIRRPWIVTALLVLLVGLGISYNLYRKEKLTRLEAERAATRAETINRFLSEDLLGAADPTGPGDAHNPTVKEVLARTAATLDARFPHDPQTRASIDLALGSAYFGLTDYATAEKFRREALQLLTASQGSDSVAALEARYQLASILAQTNRLDEASAMLDAADRLAGPRLSENSRLALQAHWTRAGYYKVRMSAAQAVGEYSAADRIRTAVDPENDNLLVRLRDGLSWCYVRLGRTEEAEKVLHEVISPRYPPERVGPVFWSIARIDDAIALMSLQRYDEAEQDLKAALAELRRSLSPDHFFVGYAENEFSELYIRRHEWAAAVDSLRDAYRIFVLRTGEHGQATVSVEANLGIVEYRTGHFDDAVATLTRARTDFISTLGQSSPQAQIVAFYLASAERENHHLSAAAALVTDLEPAKLADAEPRDDWDARLKALKGAILLGQGHKTDALALLVPAMAEMEKSHTPLEDQTPFKALLGEAR
jgi:eukaryotic-like serine/threonine-protein kinase